MKQWITIATNDKWEHRTKGSRKTKRNKLRVLEKKARPNTMKNLISSGLFEIFQKNVRTSVQQLKLNRNWKIENVVPAHAGVNQQWLQPEKMHLLSGPSEFWPQPDWDALAWPQESDSHHMTQEYCCFVKRNGAFFLTIVQVWSAITENVW